MNVVVPTTNSLNQGINSQVMMDQLKSMLLTMAMVKSTNQTDSQSTFINTIMFMIVVSFVDSIVIQIKRLLGIISSRFDTYLSTKTKDIAIINSITSMVTKTKKSSIIVKVEIASKNPTSDSIIDLLTHLPHTKCILLQNGVYTINYNEEIEISKGLYAQLVNSSISQISKVTKNNNENADKPIDDSLNTQLVTSNDDQEGGLPYGYIDIYS